MPYFQNFKDLKISEEEMPEYIPLKISSPEEIKETMAKFTDFANQTCCIKPAFCQVR